MENKRNHLKCHKCGGNGKPSKALNNTWVSFDDFGNDAGQKGTTMSRVGPSVMIDCLKCESCGHSWVPIEENDRTLAMKWWNSLSSIRKTQVCDTNTELVGSVRRWESLTGREIQMLFEKGIDIVGVGNKTFKEDFEEIVSRIKQNKEDSEVFNLENPAKFTVKELKAFAEEFASQCQEKPKGTLTGFWNLCKDMFYDKFQKKSYQPDKSKFDKEKFHAYVVKFSDEEKGEMFRMLFDLTPDRNKHEESVHDNFYTAISRAYNAGKQAMAEQSNGGDFVGSNTYYEKEFSSQKIVL